MAGFASFEVSLLVGFELVAAGMGKELWRRLLVFLPLLLLPPPGVSGFATALDSDFTFTLPAGRKECFFQPMQSAASLELEYQVLDGAGLDVDFHLISPRGETLVFEQRKSDGVHTVETEDGDYMFCFDNTFSTLSEKLIFFELILDNVGDDEEQEDWKKYVTGTDLLDMKLEDILESVNSVKSRLSKSIQIQTLLRAFEARDRNIQESNFDRSPISHPIAVPEGPSILPSSFLEGTEDCRGHDRYSWKSSSKSGLLI